MCKKIFSINVVFLLLQPSYAIYFLDDEQYDLSRGPKVHPYVCRIVWRGEDGGANSSGSFITPSKVLTVSHVIDGRKTEDIFVHYVPKDGDGSTKSVRVYSKDTFNNSCYDDSFAVLTLEEPVSVNIVPLGCVKLYERLLSSVSIAGWGQGILRCYPTCSLKVKGSLSP